MKYYANRRMRRISNDVNRDIGNYNYYRKCSDSWDICDNWYYKTWDRVMREFECDMKRYVYGESYSRRWNIMRDDPNTNTRFTYKYWYTMYKRK